MIDMGMSVDVCVGMSVSVGMRLGIEVDAKVEIPSNVDVALKNAAVGKEVLNSKVAVGAAGEDSAP